MIHLKSIIYYKFDNYLTFLKSMCTVKSDKFT